MGVECVIDVFPRVKTVKTSFFDCTQAPIGDDNYLRMAAQLRTSSITSGAASIAQDANVGQHGAAENQSTSFSAFFLEN